MDLTRIGASRALNASGVPECAMTSSRLQVDHEPKLVLMGATCAAVLLATDQTATAWLGGLLALAVFVYSVRSSWLILLALFPLAFAMRPAPPAIGAPEAVFALFTLAALLRSGSELFVSAGWRGVASTYALPVLVAGLLSGINLAVAVFQGVSLADWLRGLIPFVFLILALPLVQILRGRPERLRWLAIAMALLALLMAGNVILVYISESLHRPVWMIVEDGVVKKITESMLAMHPDAEGPFWERVTMLVPQATNALFPAGLAMAVVVAVRASSRMLTMGSTGLALVLLVAILMTQTRSMLLVVLTSITLFAVVVAMYWRSRLIRFAALLGIFIAAGWSMSQITGLDDVWSDRMSRLVVAANEDSNITSRIEELRIAWAKFLDHPVLGNGLGAKHTMRSVSLQGVLEQQVAYVHNWPAYFLMATGGVGFLVYCGILMGPVFLGVSGMRHEPIAQTAVRVGVLTLSIYGLFFAVFRLIDFNLILALAWAVMLAKRSPKSVGLVV